VADLEPDGHGLTVLPFWGGERSPGWADDARGAILGLRLHTQPRDILRASLEAVALRFNAIYQLLRPSLAPDAQVVATGGALVNSPTWTQILADVLETPVVVSREREASSRGTALLAARVLGLRNEPLDALTPQVDRRHQPNPANAKRYRAAAERQRQAYAALVEHDPLRD
jgi:gluconokinase